MLLHALALTLAVAAPGGNTNVAKPGVAPPHDVIRFRWQAPADCPGEADVRAAIEQRLGEPLAVRSAPRITIIVDVRQQPNQEFGVNVWTVDDDGLHQRQLTDADCRSIADAAALVAAMAIDVRVQEQANEDSEAARVARKLRDVQEVRPPPETLTPGLPASAPPVSRGVPLKPTPRRDMKLRGALRLSGGVIVGDLPVPGGVLRVTPALLLARWRLELEFSYGPGRLQSESRLNVMGGALRACPLLSRRRVEFPLCLGAEVGSMSATGENSIPGDKWDLYVALHLSAGLAFVVHPRVALVLGVEGATYLKRTKLYMEKVNQNSEVELAQIPTGYVSFRGLAGVEFRFP